MGRKVKPPLIQHTTGSPYLDFFAAAVALAIKDVEHPSAARPHDAYTALAFLTENPVAAGLVHLIIARFLFFNATHIIGANPTAAITRTAVIFSVILGVVFLGESITGLQIFAALLIMFGAILTTTEISRNVFRISMRGLLMSLGCALCSAGSATLIRPVMETTDAIYAGNFITYLAAFITVVVILLVRGEYRQRVLLQDHRSWSLLSIGGAFLVLGHLFRFSALQRSPVSIVQPLVSTIVLFVLFFSPII